MCNMLSNNVSDNYFKKLEIMTQAVAQIDCKKALDYNVNCILSVSWIHAH